MATMFPYRKMVSHHALMKGSLGGIAEDLDAQLRAAADAEPAVRAGVDSAREQVNALNVQYGDDVQMIGGLVNQIGALGEGIADSRDGMRIANEILNTLGSAANAIIPGVGSLMVAATQILMRIGMPAAHALSVALYTPTRGEKAWNDFLHVMHYSTGSYGSRYEEPGLARAFADGWWVEWVPVGRRSFGARSMVEFWYNMTTANITMTCWPALHRSILEGSAGLVRAVADAVDTMMLAGDVAGARDKWTKLIDLTDKIMPNGRSRFESISGIRAEAVLDERLYPDYPIPSTIEEAATPAYTRVLLGNREVMGNRFDILGFKVTRLPRDVWDGVVGGMFAAPEEQPCDFWIRWLLAAMAGTRYHVPQAPVLQMKILGMAAQRRISARTEYRSSAVAAKPSSSVPIIVGGLGVAGLAAWLLLK